MIAKAKSARFLPIAYFAGSHLGFELRRAISDAVREQRLRPLTPSVEGEFSDRLFAINAKHSGVPVVGDRIATAWGQIRKQAVQRDPELDAYALDVPRQVVRQLVVDIEALFTLLKSILDVSCRLVGTVERRVLRLATQQQTDPDELLSVPGLSSGDRTLLDEVRHSFVHESAPWFDVILHNGEPPDLAIRYRGSPDFEEGTGYVLLSTVPDLVRGVGRYLDGVEGHLVARVRSTGLKA